MRRTDFAGRIATVLSELSLDEGRVFAIRGPWGHGKSSLKNLVIEKLQAREDGADWLEFNPWQWGDADAIARALFQQIADKLGGGYSSKAVARAAALRRYGSILTGVGEPLNKASGGNAAISSILANASIVTLSAAVGLRLPTVAFVAAALATAAIVAPLIGKGLVTLGRDRWSEPLDQIRRSLENSLRTLRQPLVVFVDDIDRLEPDQIRLLFRQIKVNANLPNIIFVLLFQPDIVEAALDPVANGQGREFLAKIVQANFDLPAVPTSAVHAALGGELSRLAGAHATAANGFEDVRWGNVLIGCIQPNVRNLRDGRRYLSSVAIHLPLHAGEGAFEVNIIDFLALEALRVFEPDLHDALFRERDLLLQTSRFRQDGREAEHRGRVEQLLSIVPEARRATASESLKLLFPTVEWALGGTHYGEGWHVRWIDEKRVCTARFFSRHFELQTPEAELSESEFVELLRVSDDSELLNGVIASIAERALLPSLAARLDESVARLPVESGPTLLPAMFRLAQELVSSRSGEPFNSPWVSAWRSISWFVRRVPADQRHPLVLEAFRSTGALSVAAILIHLNDPADRKGNESDRSEPDLDEVTVAALKQEWLAQVSRLAGAPNELLAHADVASLLYRWRDYSGGIDAPRAWVSEVIETDAGFAGILAALMNTGTSHGWGDRVAVRYESFEKKNVELFMDLDAARRRLAILDMAALTPERAHAADVLRSHLEIWDRGAED